MDLSSRIYDRDALESYRNKSIRIRITKPDRKKFGKGALRILFVRETDAEVLFILSYEDYE